MKAHEQQSQSSEKKTDHGSRTLLWSGVKDQAPEDKERTRQIEEAKKKGSGAL